MRSTDDSSSEGLLPESEDLACRPEEPALIPLKPREKLLPVQSASRDLIVADLDHQKSRKPFMRGSQSEIQSLEFFWHLQSDGTSDYQRIFFRHFPALKVSGTEESPNTSEPVANGFDRSNESGEQPSMALTLAFLAGGPRVEEAASMDSFAGNDESSASDVIQIVTGAAQSNFKREESLPPAPSVDPLGIADPITPAVEPFVFPLASGFSRAESEESAPEASVESHEVEVATEESDEHSPVLDVADVVNEHLSELLSARQMKEVSAEKKSASSIEDVAFGESSREGSTERAKTFLSRYEAVDQSRSKGRRATVTDDREFLSLRAMLSGSEISLDGQVGSSELQKSEQNQANLSKDDEDTVSSPGIVEQLDSPLATLARAGDWEQLSSESEQRLHDSTAEDYEARLWWVRSQLALRQVPVSILAAPVDTATRAILVENRPEQEGFNENSIRELRSFAVEVLVETAEQMQEIEDYQTAVTFLHRAQQIDPSLSSTLLSVVQLALRSAREVPEYQWTEANSNSVAALEQLESEFVERSRKAAASKKVGRAQKESNKNREEPEEIVQAEDDTSIRIPPVWYKRVFHNRGAQKMSMAAAVALAVAATAFWGRGLFIGVQPDDAIAAAEIAFEDNKTQPGLRLDPLERMAALGHLDALLYEMQTSSGGERNSTTKNVQPLDSASVKMVPPQVEARKSVKTVPTVPDLEVVDTTSPKEPATVRRIMVTPDSAATKGPRRVDGNYVKGFPGKDYPTRGYPVYRFSPPRVYKIISRTRVLARPTYTSAVRAELKADSRIEVEEDMTLWLKIRSRNGQVGYILAQDAIYVDEKL